MAEQKRLTAEANERAEVARKDADAQVCDNGDDGHGYGHDDVHDHVHCQVHVSKCSLHFQNALELKQTIAKFTRDAHEKESELTITIAGLRNALTAAEARAGAREDQMAKDIQVCIS